MNYKMFAPLTLFLVAAVFFVWGLEWRKQVPSTVVNRTLVGKTFPEFSLPSVDGKQLFDQNYLPDKPYLVNIWASWCPSCYVEHDFLNRLANRGVIIIGLNYKDDTQKALKYLNDLGNPYHLIVADKKGSLAIDLGVTGAPETYLVGGDGIIYYKHQGVIDDRLWDNTLQPLYDKLNNI